MIPGLSGAEFLAVVIIAVLIIPSKDLPKVARECGKLWVKLKVQISNIRAQFDQAMSEAELEEIKQTGSHISDAIGSVKNPQEAVKKYVNKAVASEQLNIVQEVKEEVSKVSDDITKETSEPLEAAKKIATEAEEELKTEEQK
ncbi:MAG: hypothetical protein ACK5MJ_08795 [Alphaproteobacteria bacterium]